MSWNKNLSNGIKKESYIVPVIDLQKNTSFVDEQVHRYAERTIDGSEVLQKTRNFSVQKETKMLN